MLKKHLILVTFEAVGPRQEGPSSAVRVAGGRFVIVSRIYRGISVVVAAVGDF